LAELNQTTFPQLSVPFGEKPAPPKRAKPRPVGGVNTSGAPRSRNGREYSDRQIAFSTIEPPLIRAAVGPLYAMPAGVDAYFVPT
jgi:hypothetical protein